MKQADVGGKCKMKTKVITRRSDKPISIPLLEWIKRHKYRAALIDSQINC